MQKSKSALMKWLARSLIRLIPMGESAVDFTTDVLPTLSQDVYGWWSGKSTPEERRDELETIIAADPKEMKDQVEGALNDVAGESDEPIDPERRDRVRQYLEQVPDAIRRSMRRPDDASGRTVPPHLAPRNAGELGALLPQRTPKFRAGDKPIPGVDLELVSSLGAGGFGEVWRASKTHIGQDVALKFCLDPHAQASLRNETALLRRLMSGDAMHPGIVRLIGTYNDCSVLEYEYVKGGDLAGVIREWHADGKRPSPKLVIESMRQIAEIVAFAHQLDPPLVHRDLKPANILVQKGSDSSLRFRLTDFGIGGIATAAQAADSTKPSNTVTLSISLNGSYSMLYASPQQMRAEKPQPSDDVYSLGVIFWQMANGDLTDGAPGGTSWTDDLKNEGYSSAAVTLLASCFDRKPERRPKTAAEFAMALKPIPVAPPPMKPYAEKPKIPANTPTRVIGQVTPLIPQRVKENAVPPKRISSANWWIIGGVVAVVLLLGCMISAIIFAAIDSSKPVPFNTNTNTDPQLRGWTTTEGDSFVTTVTTPDGPAIVVQNDESNFLIHRNGMRVPVIYNSQTNMWQNLPPE